MSETETEKIAEVALPPVRVPEEIKKLIDELKYLDLRGDKIKLYLTADIMREALFKGLRLMLLEREILDRITKEEAAKGAIRIHASLIEPVEKGSQTTTGLGEESGKMEKIKVVEENEPENVEEPESEEEEEGEG